MGPPSRVRSIVVPVDVSHSNDYMKADSDFVIMNHYTSPTKNGDRSLPVVDNASKMITRPNRRTSSKTQGSVDESKGVGSDYINNLDPLMGSMEFDQSQNSFANEDEVDLPAENYDDNMGGGGGGGNDDLSVSSSESSASSKSSEYTNSAEKRRAAQKKRELTIGQKETMAIRRTRSTLFCFIISIAILGAITTSIVTVNNELESFERDFTIVGETIVYEIQQKIKSQYQALDTLSNDIVAITEGSNFSEWPFVTIPSSSSILERYMSVIQTPLLSIYPIVQASQRAQWEQYAALAQGWIDDDLQTTMILLDTVNTSTTGQNRRSLIDNNSEESPSSNVFETIPPTIDPNTIPKYIHGANNIPLAINESATYAVWWQYAPIISDRSIINFNAMTPLMQAVSSSEKSPYATMSPTQNYTPKKKKKHINNDYATNEDDDMNTTVPASPTNTAADIIEMILQKQSATSYTSGDPYSYIYYPILNTDTNSSGSSNRMIVAVISATIEWKSYLTYAISDGHDEIVCVIHEHHGANENKGDDLDDVVFSFVVDTSSDQVFFLGYVDYHDPSFDHLVVSFNITLDIDGNTNKYTGFPYNHDIVSYSVHIYPTENMKDSYTTSTSIKVAGGILFCFLLTVLVFCYYDAIVAKRQKKVMDNAAKTYDIVSSLFPATVRDRMMQDCTMRNHDSSTMLGRNNLSQLLLQDSHHSSKTKIDPSKAIADFYPSATVLFADITGFTAWCASREPSQVFTLLETIFSAYDSIAKKRKVFKVETIGDCYMAVTGLPEPRTDHAVVMCRFARQCLSKLRGILNELEVTLGPGTADLNMRFGLHSGPVTAGVLRVSQNARFQLFGDTVNTAARMESNGSPGMIHVSQETANELSTLGKQAWFYPRSEKIIAKGKGELQTYWLDLSAGSIDDRMSLSTSSIHSALSMQQGENSPRLKRTIGGQEVALADLHICRLVDWVLDTLNPMLCRVVSRRTFIDNQQGRRWATIGASNIDGVKMLYGPNLMDDIISAGSPTFDMVLDPKNPAVYDDQPLDTIVADQLHDYVHLIASRYRNDNPYHNFEHAAHAVMSIVSFINRITSALKSHLEMFNGDENPNELVQMLNHMRNIFDDPMTSFACVLACLVHDVDHDGAPKRRSPLSPNGCQKQVSMEHHSIHVAWSLMLQSEFKLLRGAIFGPSAHGNDSDLNRFRYIFVRAVLATEINPAHNRNDAQYDPNQSESKSQLFQGQATSQQSEMIVALLHPPSEIMGKAMSMLEYMMQLSDIGHMIQQWPIYMKWNERLFQEYLIHYNANNNIKAMRRRSSSSDSTIHHIRKLIHPSVYWYETELRYMKQYVMPITEKMCAEFNEMMQGACSMSDGAATMGLQKNQKCSKEYYIAVSQLVNEWTLRGRTIVDEMVSKYIGHAQHQGQLPTKSRHCKSSNIKVSNSSGTAAIDVSSAMMHAPSILVMSQDANPTMAENEASQVRNDPWMERVSPKENQQQHEVNMTRNPVSPSSNTNDLSGKTDFMGNNSKTSRRNKNSLESQGSEDIDSRRSNSDQQSSPTATAPLSPPEQRSQSPPEWLPVPQPASSPKRTKSYQPPPSQLPPARQKSTSSHSPFTFL